MLNQIPAPFLESSLEKLNIGLTLVDISGQIIYYNHQADAFFEWSKGCHGDSLIPTVLNWIKTCTGKNGEWHKVVQINGRYIENYYSTANLPALSGILIVSRDITDREEMANLLKDTLNKMSVLLEAAKFVNSSLDIHQVLTEFVEIARHAVSFDAGAVYMLNQGNMLEPIACYYLTSEDDYPLSLKVEQGQSIPARCFRAGVSVMGREEELLGLRKGLTAHSGMAIPLYRGEEVTGVFYIESESRGISIQEHGKFLETMSQLMAVALKNCSLYEQIQFEATTDQLTRLYNRLHFKRTFDKIKAGGQSFGAIMIDINGLKYVNDNFGHEKGDELIIGAAQVIKEALPQEELIFRNGGDEFLVLMPQAGPAQVMAAVEKLRAQEMKKPSWDNFSLSISVGGCSTAEGFPADKVLAVADARMYQDKKNYYSIHDRRGNK